MHLRTVAAIAAGKAAGAASRLLGRGGGTAIAGLVAERVDRDVVRALMSKPGAGAICVTGTNGKTTTSLMLNRIAEEAGLHPLHNRSGSNMMRGIAAELVQEATLAGDIPDAARRLAILEVDEATLPRLLRTVTPRTIVFTNLFRDQLDRYGEVDTIARKWETAITGLAGTTLVLNADDPAVAHLAGDATEPVLFYGIEDGSAGSAADEHASDFRTCLDCGAELTYTATFYGHIGHWRCPNCPNARPRPQVRGTRVMHRDGGMSLEIDAPQGELRIELPLTGLYNVYNALAATAGAMALGLPSHAIARALDGFSAAFGRQERFAVDGRDVRMLLGKNPAGLNQALRAISSEPASRYMLFFLNDGIADGRDVSWIWDTDYELVREGTAWVMAAGTRAEDLALRLKYAGFGPDVPIDHRVSRALEHAIDATPAGGTLYVVPTYTAMLEARELLAKGAGARRFWEGA